MMMLATQGGLHQPGDVPFGLNLRLNSGMFDCYVVPNIMNMDRVLRDTTKPLSQCATFFKPKIDEIGQQTIDEHGSNVNIQLKIIQMIMSYSATIGIPLILVGLMAGIAGLLVIGIICMVIYILTGFTIFFHFMPAYEKMYENWTDKVAKQMPGWIDEYKQQHCQPDWVVSIRQWNWRYQPDKQMDCGRVPCWYAFLNIAGFFTFIQFFVYALHPCCLRWEASERNFFSIQVTTSAANQQQQMQQQVMQMGAGLVGLNMGVAMGAPIKAASQTGVAPAQAANPAPSQAANMQAQFANLDPGQQQLLLATMQAMQNGGGVSSGVEGVQLRTSEGTPATSEGPPAYTGV